VLLVCVFLNSLLRQDTRRLIREEPRAATGRECVQHEACRVCGSVGPMPAGNGPGCNCCIEVPA
jgi:hypothetical protein